MSSTDRSAASLTPLQAPRAAAGGDGRAFGKPGASDVADEIMPMRGGLATARTADLDILRRASTDEADTSQSGESAPPWVRSDGRQARASRDARQEPAGGFAHPIEASGHNATTRRQAMPSFASTHTLPVRRQAVANAPHQGGATESISSGIASTRGGGAPLPERTRHFMESRFDADFSDVRIHSDEQATGLARGLDAQAFTTGRDIYFDAARYAPESPKGRWLLAHELAHTLQQGTGARDTVQRKCDVDRALEYYRETPRGKKTNLAAWLENMRKVAGKTHRSLYDDARADGKIGRSFVLLVCKVQEMLHVGEDGEIGSDTEEAFEKFTTGGEKGIDYRRLFSDKKLEVGIAIGVEFNSEYTAIVAYLEGAGKGLKNFSSTGSANTRLVKFTKDFPVQGDNTAAPVAIDVEFSIINADSPTPKKTFSEFLSQREIAIYSGHARYGTGPDFDDKKSVKENFIIGVNSALHAAGKLTKGYDEHMNKILESHGNDLEAMSKAGKFDGDKYQVWFFNACSSINYLDEIRGGLVTDKAGKIKSSANLRIFGTKPSIYSDALGIVEAIVNMKTMEEIIALMDAQEKKIVKSKGETEKPGYYFSN